MDFCYVWLAALWVSRPKGSTVINSRCRRANWQRHEGRGLDHFTEGLPESILAMAAALKPGAPLAFTYHHNKLEAYHAVGVAILDAGLTCSASLPCPAEMGGSIHIHGTASSIVDTVFVCRYNGRVPRRWLFTSVEELVVIVASDLANLSKGGCKPTGGDTRCIAFGHLTRMAVWNLRKDWNCRMTTDKKLARFGQASMRLADPEVLLERLTSGEQVSVSARPLFAATK